MGTRADFYVGKEWLGSLGFDGYRIYEMEEKHANDSEDNRYCWAIITAKTEPEYRQAVSNLLRINDDASTPEHGWPWPWEDSRTTDRAYVFDGDETKAYAWGKAIIAGDDEAEGPEPADGWPDMTAAQNVTIGTNRAGNILLVGRGK